MTKEYEKRRQKACYQKRLKWLYGAEWKKHYNEKDCINYVVGNKKSVEQIEITTGAVVKLHKSMSSAAREFGASSIKAIWKVCNGEIKTAYGFKWRYA
jgi:hypothetical protein